MTTTVYVARKILTMNPSQPEATHIAVRNGRILAVGPEEAMQGLGEARVDERFAEQVILPGFVEGHSHALEGAMWEHLYLGYFPRRDPDGNYWRGAQSVSAMQQRLRDQAGTLPPSVPLIAWGFDPVYFEGARLDRRALDVAVNDRPVVIVHASLHVMTVNSRMLDLAGLHRHPGIQGIMIGDDGKPNGELQEMAAMHAVFETLGMNLFEAVGTPVALRRYGRVARNAGVTTITDLYNPMTDEGVAALKEVTREADYPVRLVPAMSGLAWPLEEGIERLQACREQGNDKLHFGLVKLMTDGSIGSGTAWNNGEMAGGRGTGGGWC